MDSQGFVKLWERFCETLEEDWQRFVGIHEDLQVFGRVFARFVEIHEDS